MIGQKRGESACKPCGKSQVMMFDDKLMFETMWDRLPKTIDLSPSETERVKKMCFEALKSELGKELKTLSNSEMTMNMPISSLKLLYDLNT